MKRLSLNPHKNSSLTACRVHDSMIENRSGSNVFSKGVNFEKVLKEKEAKKAEFGYF